jgi:hypothetical protein
MLPVPDWVNFTDPVGEDFPDTDAVQVEVERTGMDAGRQVTAVPEGTCADAVPPFTVSVAVQVATFRKVSPLMVRIAGDVAESETASMPTGSFENALPLMVSLSSYTTMPW